MLLPIEGVALDANPPLIGSLHDRFPAILARPQELKLIVQRRRIVVDPNQKRLSKSERIEDLEDSSMTSLWSDLMNVYLFCTRYFWHIHYSGASRRARY